MKNSYRTKDSPERWIMQLELQPYDDDDDETTTYEIDCPIVTGDDQTFDGLVVEIPYDTVILWFKKDNTRWLAWSEYIGWYKEEYREIVLECATEEGDFQKWLSYNSVYGPTYN